MDINAEKTKLMTISVKGTQKEIEVRRTKLGNGDILIHWSMFLRWWLQTLVSLA